VKQITIFFDGTCGLCHSCVRFVLFRMPEDTPFLFCSKQKIDSVMLEYDGKILRKTKAIILILSHLNWPWKGLSFVLRFFPLTIADWGYDQVAKIRHRFFKNPKSLCPLVPKQLQKYFVQENDHQIP
jgi:predicted DCC family thiol-disulfide oxidoreductase YuxK